MFYPKSDLCPFNSDEDRLSSKKTELSLLDADVCKDNTEHENNSSSKCEMMRKIQELDFAIIDLNLFLDTHPNCMEALDLFTQLSATAKSLKIDYQSKYGPLYVTKSSKNVPFQWVEPCYKWPWEM